MTSDNSTRNGRTKQKLMEKANVLLENYSKKAYEIATKAILSEKIGNEIIHEALRYFLEEIWYDVQHPALLSLSCEAIGKSKPDIIDQIGAAMMLLAGAADIHDDIIDKSKSKGYKLTVFGKFGEDIALLAGDSLLFEGLRLLSETCDKLPKEQKTTILNMIKSAFFKISSAEAKEVGLRSKYDLSPEEFFDIIKMKAVVAEVHAQIGAILGGGLPKEIEALGKYGKNLEILMTIRNEFIDIFEPEELMNRIVNECLPLPVLFAFRNPMLRREIIRVLRKKKMTEKDANVIADIIFEARETQSLKKIMKNLIQETILEIDFTKNSKIHPKLKLLLKASMEDL